jgi:hypothetical protein
MPSTKFFTRATCRGFNRLFSRALLRFAISDLQGRIIYDAASASHSHCPCEILHLPAQGCSLVSLALLVVGEL